MPTISFFPLPVRLVATCLLLVVCVSSWGQAKPEAFADLLRHYSSSHTALAAKGWKTVLLGRSTVRLPLAGLNIRTGTIDSDRGELQSARLLIHYDIGEMAGTHIASRLRAGPRGYFPEKYLAAFNAYQERIVETNLVTLGLKSTFTNTEVVATLFGNYSEDTNAIPANFWANIQSTEDLKYFLSVVFSYRAATKK